MYQNLGLGLEINITYCEINIMYCYWRSEQDIENGDENRDWGSGLGDCDWGLRLRYLNLEIESFGLGLRTWDRDQDWDWDQSFGQGIEIVLCNWWGWA